MFDNFWKFTEQFVTFTQQERVLIQDRLTFAEVPKDYKLIELGEIAREVYFINRGCLRFYYLTEEGKEITGFIFTEHMFAGSHESFFAQVPSIQVVETLESSELIVLTYEKLHELYELIPRMNVFGRKLLEQRMMYAQKVVASLIMNRPEQRYTSLLELHPELIHRVPQQVLATYLGITPVSLSRIRRRMQDKDAE